MARSKSGVVTMREVAAAAGVSVKTVSRYINGETNISPELTVRIAKAVEELGYRRNLAAASIRPGHTSSMVGLVISDLANPYYSVLARAAEKELSAAGYMLIVASSEESGEVFDRVVERLMELRVDGLLIVPPHQQGRKWDDIPPPVPPVVFLDRPGFSPRPGMDAILADNYGGSYVATEKLIQGGATELLFVGDARGIFTIRERYSGFLAAADAAGIPTDSVQAFFDAHSREDARDAVGAAMDAGFSGAVFAANNRATIGTLEAFQKRDRRLPLVGFDDFEAAHLIGSGISVVSQDIEDMGRSAARLLLSRMNGSEDAARTVTLNTRLILRGSERPSPASSRGA